MRTVTIVTTKNAAPASEATILARADIGMTLYQAARRSDDLGLACRNAVFAGLLVNRSLKHTVLLHSFDRRISGRKNWNRYSAEFA